MEDVFTKNIWYLGRFKEKWIIFKIIEKDNRNDVLVGLIDSLEEIIVNRYSEVNLKYLSYEDFLKEYEKWFYYITSEDMKPINIHLIEE